MGDRKTESEYPGTIGRGSKNGTLLEFKQRLKQLAKDLGLKPRKRVWRIWHK